MRSLAVLLVFLVACGGDDPPVIKPAAPGAPAAPAAPAAVPGAGSGKPLPIKRHAEDRVSCPIPREGSHKCDPAASKPIVIGGQAEARKPEDLWCEDGEVCQNTTAGYLCGACPERFSIRHDFKDRDFAAETNRDPFQSFVVKVPGQGSGSDGAIKDPTSRCVRAEQLRVSNYGYQDLKLVGIVSQGTQRKVLMMDPGNYGHIIKRGDCVGKEKAWVKDIGENFVCFEMSADQAAASRLPEGMCIELHTKQIEVTSLPSDSPDPARITTTPVLPPTTPTTPKTGQPTTTTPPPPQQPQQPPRVPTNIKP